jgi:hypothetical protein
MDRTPDAREGTRAEGIMAGSDCGKTAWIISNEFAQVRLTIDLRGNDPRLLIEDLSNDTSAAFDAFLLAGLVTAAPEDLARHMDPNPKPRSAEPSDR